MTTMPKRLQRRRTKGWRMPAGAIYVGRPSIDGNRYFVVHNSGRWAVWQNGTMTVHQCRSRAEAHGLAVALHRRDLVAACEADPQAADLMWKRLRGYDLVCWCPPDHPCHADTLIEMANAPAAGPAADA